MNTFTKYRFNGDIFLFENPSVWRTLEEDLPNGWFSDREVAVYGPISSLLEIRAGHLSWSQVMV